jgi:competence protein ComEA
MNPRSLFLSCSLITVALALFLMGTAHAGSGVPLGVININTASVDQLQWLPGIGPSKAKAVVDYRTKHPFVTVDELRKVKGFGPKLLDKCRSYVVTRGETTAKAPAKKQSNKRK